MRYWCCCLPPQVITAPCLKEQKTEIAWAQSIGTRHKALPSLSASCLATCLSPRTTQSALATGPPNRCKTTTQSCIFSIYHLYSLPVLLFSAERRSPALTVHWPNPGRLRHGYINMAICNNSTRQVLGRARVPIMWKREQVFRDNCLGSFFFFFSSLRGVLFVLEECKFLPI